MLVNLKDRIVKKEVQVTAKIQNKFIKKQYFIKGLIHIIVFKINLPW